MWLQLNTKTIIIAVKDNGTGIPDELKDKIFDIVCKTKRTGTDLEKSNGFGLAISRQIEKHMAGNFGLKITPMRALLFMVSCHTCSHK